MNVAMPRPIAVNCLAVLYPSMRAAMKLAMALARTSTVHFSHNLNGNRMTLLLNGGPMDDAATGVVDFRSVGKPDGCPPYLFKTGTPIPAGAAGTRESAAH